MGLFGFGSSNDEDEIQQCDDCGYFNHPDSMYGSICKHCHDEQYDDDELRRMEDELVDSMYGADIDPGDEYYEE